jgi:hypothetical protein
MRKNCSDNRGHLCSPRRLIATPNSAQTNPKILSEPECLTNQVGDLIVGAGILGACVKRPLVGMINIAPANEHQNNQLAARFVELWAKVGDGMKG